MPAPIISPNYGCVLIAAGLLVLEAWFLGKFAMAARRQHFNEDFQNKNKDLLDEHKKAFPAMPFSLGYPDMGCGRFSDRLSYEQWFRFNNARRHTTTSLSPCGR